MSLQTPFAARLHRSASRQSHMSEANTIVEPLEHGESLIYSREDPQPTQRPRRTIMILIKAFAFDREQIKIEIEQQQPDSSLRSVRQPSECAPPPSQSAGPEPKTENNKLIDWAVRTYSVSPQLDSIILVNVRSSAASTKTKWYDSSIAAYAQLYDAEERGKSIKLLQKYLNQLWARGFQCRALALLGDRREEICSSAVKEKADCVVVGLRKKQRALSIPGRSNFVTSLVLSSEVPVTVVRL